jgi:hypothetical protein
MEVELRLRERREEMNGCTLLGKKSLGAEARKGNVRTNWRKRYRRNGRSMIGASFGGGEKGVPRYDRVDALEVMACISREN